MTKNQKVWNWALRGARAAGQQGDAFEQSLGAASITAAWNLLKLAHELQGIELNDASIRGETPGMFIEYTMEWKSRKKKRR